MKVPMTLSKISAKIEDITGLDVERSVTGLLVMEGAFYDSDIKMWKSTNTT
jgi:hypothetical protein